MKISDLYFSLTNTPTLTPHSSSKVYVSTGPVTGESPAEESVDGDLNIKQNITHTIKTKLVTYILYLLQKISLHYPPPPTSPIIIHIHIHHHHCSELGSVASVNVTTPADVSEADVSGADVSGDENGNHTYQVPNPIIHTPHPITGVIYTDINPQRTKKGQKVFREVQMTS